MSDILKDFRWAVSADLGEGVKNSTRSVTVVILESFVVVVAG